MPLLWTTVYIASKVLLPSIEQLMRITNGGSDRSDAAAALLEHMAAEMHCSGQAAVMSV